jgi:hypothetical protein
VPKAGAPGKTAARHEGRADFCGPSPGRPGARAGAPAGRITAAPVWLHLTGLRNELHKRAVRTF